MTPDQLNSLGRTAAKVIGTILVTIGALNATTEPGFETAIYGVIGGVATIWATFASHSAHASTPPTTPPAGSN